jgi:putative FmdB family regulatory protein
MPNYSYKCAACGAKTIYNVPIEERDSRNDLECEVCRSVVLRREMDIPGTSVRGTKKGSYNSSADCIKWNGRNA